MEGGGGSIATSNIPTTAVATNVMSGCERAYDRSPPIPESAVRAMTSSALRSTSTVPSTILKTNVAASTAVMLKDDEVANDSTSKIQNKKSTLAIIRGQEENAAGCSAATVCSSTVETSQSIKTNESASATAECPTANVELGFPAIGSPPADLMVVNTNGFNPLQHAALRGNPG